MASDLKPGQGISDKTIHEKLSDNQEYGEDISAGGLVDYIKPPKVNCLLIDGGFNLLIDGGFCLRI